jgi:hypothetical protein
MIGLSVNDLRTSSYIPDAHLSNRRIQWIVKLVTSSEKSHAIRRVKRNAALSSENSGQCRSWLFYAMNKASTLRLLCIKSKNAEL